ncbi:hypothetical protein AB0J90_20110 [Micromonospora sp. NPDC049523]|uniref:hypothetical protein n=1 Tax=Micromonospora sp. NPDC049523 TaxID=3155921 RepID=UPI00342655A2
MRTPPLPPEALDRLPGLAHLGRTATRLHPRPGEVGVRGSHVGGPLWWPADEPWPTCDRPYMVSEEVPIPAELLERMRAAEARRTVAHQLADGESELHAEIADLVGAGFTGWGSHDGGPTVGYRYVSRPHPTPHPMLPVAQLRARDIPDLPRPGGADLLQVLWCPYEHQQEGLWGPTVRLHWRRESKLTEILAEPPTSEIGNEVYRPRPCRLHPEQVVEYPFPQELPDDLRKRVDAAGGDYVGTFMMPGWKVGGYAKWSLTGPRDTACPNCAGPTTLTLVVDSKEYDGGTRDRWRPVEEQHLEWADPRRFESQEPTGVQVGRWGSLRVFVCLRCPQTPYLLDLQ